jgi:alanine dehydrogenase
VGNNAAHTAVGIGADVTVIDKSLAVLRHLDEIYGGRVKTLYATRDDIERLLMQADLVIGAVLIPGATAPKLVTRDMLARMKPGAVIVDVAIDQGGCFETSRPTTHADPTFVVDGVVHYCVANMPGAVARTATYALNAATLPYILTLADKGWKDALKDDAGLRAGLNVCNGQVTHPQVAASLGTNTCRRSPSSPDAALKETQGRAKFPWTPTGAGRSPALGALRCRADHGAYAPRAQKSGRRAGSATGAAAWPPRPSARGSPCSRCRRRWPAQSAARPRRPAA